MMRRSLYHIKWYFAKTDLNTDKGKAENKKCVVKYAKRYTPEKEAKSPTSFKVDFVGQPYEGACYYRITRCPICVYAEKLGVSELMPLFCELDEVMITLQHGVLHRKQTLANGGEYLRLLHHGKQRVISDSLHSLQLPNRMTADDRPYPSRTVHGDFC